MYIPDPTKMRPSKWDRMPIPTRGIGRVRFVLFTHFSKLIKVNLLFILFSLPVITIPASFAAMTAVIQELFRKGHCHVWEVFFKEFRTETIPRILLSLLLLLLPVGGWFLGSAIGELAAYLISAILLVAVLLTGCYWFPQMASLTIRSTLCLRNSIILVTLENWRNLLLILITGITGALTGIFWPFSALALLFIFPVLMQLLVSAVVNPVIDERIVKEESDS